MGDQESFCIISPMWDEKKNKKEEKNKARDFNNAHFQLNKDIVAKWREEKEDKLHLQKTKLVKTNSNM